MIRLLGYTESEFDDSIAGERVHRYQNQSSRALGRTLAEIQRRSKLGDDEGAVETKLPSEASLSCVQLAIHHEEPTGADVPSPDPTDVPPPEPGPQEPEPVSTKQSHGDPQVAAVLPCDEPAAVRKPGLSRGSLDLLGSDIPPLHPFSAVPLACSKKT